MDTTTLDEEANLIEANKFEEMLNKEKEDVENELNKIENSRHCNDVEMETDTVIENPNVVNSIAKTENEGHKTPPIATTNSSSVPHSALGLIANYGSSSGENSSDDCTDDEADAEKINPAHSYRKTIDAVSSDESTSSSSSSSSSSDESSSDSDDSSSSDELEIIEMEIESSNKKNTHGPIRARGEQLIEDLPPIEELKITVPETECIEIGKVQSIVAQLLLVQSIPGIAALDLDTVLFLDQGARTLGKIFDVIGQVTCPLYCIRFNSREQIDELGIEIGMKVFYAPRTEHTSFVILSNIMNVRGSDASWENDIEADESHQDYSDDEQERAARRSLKNLKTTDETSKKQKTHHDSRPTRAPTRRGGYHQYSGAVQNQHQHQNHHQNQHPSQHPSQHYSQHHNQHQNINPFHRPQQNLNNSWHYNIPAMSMLPGPSYVNPYSFRPGQLPNMNFPPPPPPPGQQ